jgi:hypothetical protein
MSFSDLFNSEFKQKNIGHFSSIVRMALADGKISPEEKAFLDRLAANLEISISEYEAILENPLKFPLNPPYLHIERLERLYDLVRIVHEDRHLGDMQEKLLIRFGLALGFSSEKVNHIVSKALVLVGEKVSLDTFLFEMEKRSE